MDLVNFSSEAITSEEEFREITGIPHEFVIKKSTPIVDEHCRRFISMSPLLFLATSNANGKCDVSPLNKKRPPRMR